MRLAAEGNQEYEWEVRPRVSFNAIESMALTVGPNLKRVPRTVCNSATEAQCLRLR